MTEVTAAMMAVATFLVGVVVGTLKPRAEVAPEPAIVTPDDLGALFATVQEMFAERDRRVVPWVTTELLDGKVRASFEYATEVLESQYVPRKELLPIVRDELRKSLAQGGEMHAHVVELIAEASAATPAPIVVLSPANDLGAKPRKRVRVMKGRRK